MRHARFMPFALLPLTTAITLAAPTGTPDGNFAVTGSVPLPSFMGSLPITASAIAAPTMELGAAHSGYLNIDPVTTTLETFFNVLPLYAKLRFEETENFEFAGSGSPVDASGQQQVFFEEIGLNFLGAHYPLFSSSECSMTLNYHLQTADSADFSWYSGGTLAMTTEWRDASDCKGLGAFMDWLFSNGPETGSIELSP